MHPCTDEKRCTSCASPCGSNRRRPPLRRGPEELRASCPHRTEARSLRNLPVITLTMRKTAAQDKTYRPDAGQFRSWVRMRLPGVLVLFTCLLVVTAAYSKGVEYRGGLLLFDVPNGWVEEPDTDSGGMFYSPETGSGTLRLTVLTFKAKSTSTAHTPVEVLRSIRSLPREAIRTLPNGNAIGEELERTTERGEKITLYWWHLASQAPERHIRIANFSYTVLSSQEGSPRVNADIKFLRASIESSRFSPQLGL